MNEMPAWMDEVPPPNPVDQSAAGTAVRERPPRNAMQQTVAPDTQQIAILEDPASREVMETLRNSLYPGASYQSIAMVLSYCRVNGLDPFLKAVHIVPMSVKKPGTRNDYEWRDVLMPGISDYRIKASRSGTYIGKSEPEFGPMVDYELSGVKVTVPEFCRITVKRLVAGHIAPFTAVEYWIENYATAKRDTQAPNSMWLRRARGQLSKCTEAQALRMAFPEFNGGVPTAEEMEGKHLEAVPVGMESTAIASSSSNKLDMLENTIDAEKTNIEIAPVDPEPGSSPPGSTVPGATGGGDRDGLPPPGPQTAVGASVRTQQAAAVGDTAVQSGADVANSASDAPSFIASVETALAIDGGAGHRWLKRLEQALLTCPSLDDLAATLALPSVKTNRKDAPIKQRARIDELIRAAGGRLTAIVGEEAPYADDDDHRPNTKPGMAA